MSGAAEIVPPGDVGEARRGLSNHVIMIQEAAKWLEANEYHAASIYFSVLCLEEISRHHVLSACEREGRGVTREDTRVLYDHRKKLARFLDGAVPAVPPGAGLPTSKEMADVLVRAKEGALYFDFGGGKEKTLEALLGIEGTKKASRLLGSVVEQGVLAMRQHGDAAQGSRGVRGKDARPDMRAALAELMEVLEGSEKGMAGRADIMIPKGHLDTVLSCLAWHLGDMAKITHELHSGRHESASVFMGVITIEEGSKHYLLAKCRREGRDVLRKDMREIRAHKKKLAAFYIYVVRSLGEENIYSDTGEYRVLDPNSRIHLHDVKKMAIHFVRMAGETMTLEAIFGSSVRNLAAYVNETAQWVISWMAMNDGDSEDPYMRHDPNPVHHERYEQFGRLMDDPENVAQYYGWVKMTGLLKELNDACEGHDVEQCATRLAAIREYGHIG